jgi:hypothetical protein
MLMYHVGPFHLHFPLTSHFPHERSSVKQIMLNVLQILPAQLSAEYLHIPLNTLSLAYCLWYHHHHLLHNSVCVFKMDSYAVAVRFHKDQSSLELSVLASHAVNTIECRGCGARHRLFRLIKQVLIKW